MATNDQGRRSCRALRWAAASAFCFAGLASAQGTADLASLTGRGAIVSRHPATGLVTFIGKGASSQALAPGQSVAAGLGPSFDDHLRTLGPHFGITDAPSQTRLERRQVNERGRAVSRYQQLHQGIPVFAGELIVNTDSRGNLLAMIGKFAPPPQLSLAPEVPAAEAARTALRATAKKHGQADESLEASAPELWIYDSRLLAPDGRDPRLAWRLSVRSLAGAPIDELVLVDAHSGEIALRFNQVAHARNRMTYDANHTSSLPGTLKCLEGTANCTSGAVPDADAAHYFAADTYDFYFSRFGRDGINGSGGAIISTVRYCPPPAGAGCTYYNAFWNGTQMAYGPGMVADDVTGHELTHGVTSFESKLFYYAEPGAINEALSDIFGELVDLVNARGNDAAGVRWLMGEDLSIGAIRSMQDPTLYGQPDRKLSALWYRGYEDVAGVHINSGVANKAAFLLVDGGTFNGRTVTAIGLEKTAQVFYEAQVALLTAGADYADLHNALFQACSNLVGTAGINAADCTEVQDATLAVEMNAVLPTIAPALSCPSGSQVYIVGSDDMEGGEEGDLLYVGAGAGWFLSSAFKTSGTYSFKAVHAGSVADTSATYQLVGSIFSGDRIYFAHRFDTEANYDGGVVEYSTNGGATWSDAAALRESGQAYTGTILSSSPEANSPLLGRLAFTGSSGAGFVATTYNLTPLAGQSNVRWRFRSATDGGAFVDGWYLDDVTFYACSTGNGSLSLTAAAETVAENAGSVKLTVNRTGGTTGAASVSFATVAGTATAGVDYVHTAGMLNWAAGDAHPKTITVPIVNRAGTQATRSFTVSLSGASGAALAAPTSATVSITNAAAANPAVPDFDGDGDPDIFWFNTDTNALHLWVMNGTTLVGDYFFTTLPSPWKVAGLADFNGDGSMDMVWHNATDGTAIVLHLANGSYLGAAVLFGLPADWGIEGVADFNADGKPDFLMRSASTGVAFAWYFANGVPTGLDGLFSLPSNWKVQGVADFTGDGQPDLLLRDTDTGLALVWGTVYSGGALALAPAPTALFSLDPLWEVVQATDWDGDGDPDLLVRNTSTGVVFVWTYDGLAAGAITGIAQRDTVWEIVP